MKRVLILFAHLAILGQAFFCAAFAAYIRLLEKSGGYLSIGGEARERYERFGNPGWGQDPQDNNGFFLQ